MYSVIRLRGEVNSRPEARKTLESLRLNRVNHMVLVPENGNYRGMLQKAKDYIAWGEVNTDTLAVILEKRGRLTGNRRLTEEYIREHTPYDSFQELAEAITSGDYKISDVPEVKPVFRLHPPRKGHKGIKQTYQTGGELGYQGEDINRLLYKMR